MKKTWRYAKCYFNNSNYNTKYEMKFNAMFFPTFNYHLNATVHECRKVFNSLIENIMYNLHSTFVDLMIICNIIILSFISFVLSNRDLLKIIIVIITPLRDWYTNKCR